MTFRARTRRRGGTGRRIALSAAAAASGLLGLAASAGASGTRAVTTETPLAKGLAFYKGKTITFIEPGATGAIFDLIARAEAPYLADYLHATVNVEDVTIGNTIPGQDETANADPDGLTIGLLNPVNDVSLALTHTPGLDFNPARLEYIAANGPASTLMVASDSSPYRTFKSVVTARPPATILMENSGTVNVIIGSLMGALGVPVHWVTGYTSIGAYVQGFVRGDGPVMAVNLASSGPLVTSGKARALFVTSVPPVGTAYRSAALGVPTLATLEKQYPAKTARVTKEYAALNAIADSPGAPIVTQTAVPSYKLAALRAAAAWMFKQAGFRSSMLAAGQNPEGVDPVTAKKDYIVALTDGPLLEPFFSGI